MYRELHWLIGSVVMLLLGLVTLWVGAVLDRGSKTSQSAAACAFVIGATLMLAGFLGLLCSYLAPWDTLPSHALPPTQEVTK